MDANQTSAFEMRAQRFGHTPLEYEALSLWLESEKRDGGGHDHIHAPATSPAANYDEPLQQ
jgi:hypothetical protein